MKILNSDFTCIFIEKFELNCYIGIEEKEKNHQQPVIIEGKFYLTNYDVKTDNISVTYDYERIIQKIKEITPHQKFSLLETFLQKIIKKFFKENQFKAIWLKAYKKKLFKELNVGVEILRYK